MDAIDKAMVIIIKYEGFRELPYYATLHEKEKGLLTIGYGDTEIDGRPVKLTDKVTKNVAYINLVARVTILEAAIKKLTPVHATENQIAACISLAYNIGLHAFAASTLLKLWGSGELLANVSAQFDRWNKQNGKVLGGLIKRRLSERNLFLTV